MNNTSKKANGFFLIGLMMALSVIGACTESRADDYHGEPSIAEVTVSGMGGFGLIDTSGGFALIGAVAKKIANRGFLTDINNQVFIELEAGPLFTSGTTAWMYSTHLRWDFQKNDEWTYFALGGLAGNIIDNKLGDRFALHPRFGIGAFYTMPSTGITLRGEISHELIIAGVSFFL